MYTDDEDKPLMEVFESISRKYEGKTVDLDLKKATPAQLADFMAGVLPDYDRERVYNNDIKKLIQWYNILIQNGYTEFVDAEAEETAETTEA